VQTHDVIIVGGGPAGSSAAHRLKRGGADVLVLDKEEFPRLKLCAGWITPDVARDLEIDRSSYPHRWITFERLHVHFKGVHLRVRSVQHSIRRYEFDAWLLERSGAPVVRHNVRRIRREADCYVIDDVFRCRYLIGAGGTSCPVYRTFFRDLNPRVRELQMVTFEHEIEYHWKDPDCHLWFFERGLPGYAWYVPKENGWLNVGVGGAAARIRDRGVTIKQHFEEFTRILGRDMVPGAQYDAAGHGYYLRSPVHAVRLDDAFIAGDSAGLATRDLGEGIGPAVRSGQRAADAILHGHPYTLDDVTGASAGGGMISRLLDWGFTRGAGKAGHVTGEVMAAGA
jgi:menaquinone-9 beta-reductase